MLLLKLGLNQRKGASSADTSSLSNQHRIGTFKRSDLLRRRTHVLRFASRTSLTFGSHNNPRPRRGRVHVMSHLRDLVGTRSRALGVSVSGIAARAGITRSYLYKLMDDDTGEPTLGLLCRLARALDVPPLVVMRPFMAPCDPAARRHRSSRWASLSRPGDAIAFIGDLTVPEHMWMSPGERFAKRWSIQNVGQLPWVDRSFVRNEEEVVLARRLAHGELQPLPSRFLEASLRIVRVPDTLPGQPCTIEIEFEAPREAGTAASSWRMVDGNGIDCFPPDFNLQTIVTVLGS